MSFIEGGQTKREGRYKGGVPTFRRQADEIIRLKQEGVRPSEVALRLAIGRANVYRTLGSRDVRVRGEDLCLYGSTVQ
jgi:DNA invertase Pin-like site-specific DNA recombinase